MKYFSTLFYKSFIVLPSLLGVNPPIIYFVYGVMQIFKFIFFYHINNQLSPVELLIEKFILSSMVLNVIFATYQVSKFVSFCSLSILFHWLVFLVTVILQYLVHYFFYLILFQVDPANLSYLCFCIKFKISLPIYTKNKQKTCREFYWDCT